MCGKDLEDLINLNVIAKKYKESVHSIEGIQDYIKIMDVVVGNMLSSKSQKEVLSKALELRSKMLFDLVVKTNKPRKDK